jgi:hypothetical protein
MASLFGNATTRGEAIVPNTRASQVDRLFQVEVASDHDHGLVPSGVVGHAPGDNRADLAAGYPVGDTHEHRHVVLDEQQHGT